VSKRVSSCAIDDGERLLLFDPLDVPSELAEGLRPLVALPVEHVLATHGGPDRRAALERALSSS